MAAAELGGYDFEFVPELPEDYICVICHCALKSPKQIENCGHRFCGSCFQNMSNRRNNRGEVECPMDRQKFKVNEVFRDKATERLILNWKVKCPNQESGCSWIGELNTVKDHEKSCKNAVSSNEQLEKQIASLEGKLTEKSFEIKKCNEEIEKLRTEINSSKAMHSKEIENLKNEIQKLHVKVNSVSKNTVKQVKESIREVQRLIKTKYTISMITNYNEEIFTDRFKIGQVRWFILGFKIFNENGNRNQLVVTLYLTNGGERRVKFRESFKFNLHMLSIEGACTTITFRKRIWSIGSNHQRSIGESSIVGSVEDYSINGHYRFYYE